MNKCIYCGNEIRPLDKHIHSISPDKILSGEQSKLVIVNCILIRYYEINPKTIE